MPRPTGVRSYGNKERKWDHPLFPLDPDDILTVGFFHMQPQIRSRWTELLDAFAQEPPKLGLPSQIRPTRETAPHVAQGWKGT
jgi:hypothetical protein